MDEQHPQPVVKENALGRVQSQTQGREELLGGKTDVHRQIGGCYKRQSTAALPTATTATTAAAAATTALATTRGTS